MKKIIKIFIVLALAFTSNILYAKASLVLNSFVITPIPVPSVEKGGEFEATYIFGEAFFEDVPATSGGVVNTVITLEFQNCLLKDNDVAVNVPGDINLYFDIHTENAGKTLVFEQSALIPAGTALFDQFMSG